MIHPASTISAIIRSLRSVGIRDTEIIEEMTDHYLSEIEVRMDEGLNEEEAIAKTISRIETTHLELLQSKKRSVWPYALGAIVILLGILSFYLIRQPIDGETEVATDAKEVIIEVTPNGWPIAKPKARITSHFGKRTHPVTKHKILHRGIDIMAPIGTPILATGDATVKEIGYNKKAGQYIILRHGERYTTKYFHLSDISVAEGDTITKGTTIGLSGNSGISTAPHLHYEIIDQNAPIDPMECIRV